MRSKLSVGLIVLVTTGGASIMPTACNTIDGAG
jgi:predicted small secreted protein